MADHQNTSQDARADRMDELIRHQINKQSEQNQQQEKLSDALTQLIAQQQQTNEQLLSSHMANTRNTAEEHRKFLSRIQ